MVDDTPGALVSGDAVMRLYAGRVLGWDDGSPGDGRNGGRDSDRNPNVPDVLLKVGRTRAGAG